MAAGGTAYGTFGLKVFPVLVMRKYSPANFVWVLFWDLTKIYLFENKNVTQLSDFDVLVILLLSVTLNATKLTEL